MGVHPPRVVEMLLMPVEPLGKLVGRLLPPHPNVGTLEHSVYEGTLLDVIAGLALVHLCILLYPVATFTSSCRSCRRLSGGGAATRAV